MGIAKRPLCLLERVKDVLIALTGVKAQTRFLRAVAGVGNEEKYLLNLGAAGFLHREPH